ncbi:hypothetical protein BJF78_06320 [Pseudonocardia sp. CNS-139]|nr:hypothetical protein BJF78_06320 [Pseudonocardia sp. CNS-139]
MNDAKPQNAPAPSTQAVRDREGTMMLLHEALARSRQQEAIESARQHALARQFVAGRRWALLARFAARRAARARAAASAAQYAAVLTR